MRRERGSVLVEFALVSLVLYLILAAAIDFGRLMFTAQALQDAARLAARELSVTPLPVIDPDPTLPPGTPLTFERALAYQDAANNVDVPRRIFNPRCLVIDLDAFKSDDDPDQALIDFVSGMPIVNRALRAVMIVDKTPDRNLLRYPGALLSTTDSGACTSTGDTAHPSLTTNLTVGIPRVTGRSAEGFETIDWLPVVEEIKSSGAVGPFSPVPDPTTPLPPQQLGLVAVRINYPYQAAMISSFRPNPDGPAEPNLANVNEASDAAVSDPGAPFGTPVVGDDEGLGAYTGKYGLGRQVAFTKFVRPYRRVLAAQSIYRREVFQ